MSTYNRLQDCSNLDEAPMFADTFCVIAGTFGMLIGGIMPDGYAALIQGGAFVVLAYAFLHILVKTLPERDKKFCDAMKEAAAARIDTDKDIARRREEMDKQLVDQWRLMTVALTDLRVHCATQCEVTRQLKAQKE